MLKLRSRVDRPEYRDILHYWFEEKPTTLSVLAPSLHYHSKSLDSAIGYQQVIRSTSILSIDRDDRELLAGFTKSTRYEVKRADAERGEITIALNQPPDIWNRDAGKHDTTSTYQENIVESCLRTGTGRKVCHRYLCDTQASRVHLLSSSSDYAELETPPERAQLARLNRLLHYEDMRYFRDKEVKLYDFGGLSLGPRGSKLGNIDAFKLGFGGKTVAESIYIHCAIIFYNRLVHGRNTSV